MEKDRYPSVRSRSSFFRNVNSIWKEYETARNFISFFVFGLTNNFCYVTMLSAAMDLLSIIDKISKENDSKFQRECNSMSTGALLLANIIPGIAIKLAAPCLPLYINLRMVVVVGTAVMGLNVVALTISRTWIIVGICLVSVSQGLGESSLLAYTVFFQSKKMLNMWSSGTGLAGLLGSFSYSFLSHIGLTPQNTIYCALCMPSLMAIMFWFVVEKPMFRQFELDKAHLKQIHLQTLGNHSTAKDKDQSSQNHPTSTLRANIKTIPKILRTYTIWYGLVYFFEYFINQGLFEFIFIPSPYFDHPAQYRWFNTLYQLGVFISRSSMDIVEVDRLYLTAIFQGINAVLIWFEAAYGYLTYIPIVFCLIVWEGLLGGACYVNTYRLISTRWPAESQEFAIAFNSLGDSVTVSMAGLIAIPAHYYLCTMPPTYGRSYFSAP